VNLASKRLLAVALFAGALSASGSASAAKKISPALQFRQDVTEYVTCLIEKERSVMVTYVAERTGDIARLLHTNCLSRAAGGRLNRPGERIDTAVWVGLAAERLLREIDLSTVDTLLPGAPAIDHGEPMTVEKMSPKSKLSKAEKEVWVASVNRKRTFDMLAECLVRKNAGLSRRVFLSDYGSDAESAALNEMMAIRSECASIELSVVNPRSLRVYLASNYAHLAGLADPSFKEKLL
jgi:hypothetical protein